MPSLWDLWDQDIKGSIITKQTIHQSSIISDFLMVKNPINIGYPGPNHETTGGLNPRISLLCSHSMIVGDYCGSIHYLAGPSHEMNIYEPHGTLGYWQSWDYWHIIHQSDWWFQPTPLKNMSSSVGMMTFPIYGKIKNVPNHQSVYYTNPLIHANVHVVYDINRIHKMVTPKIIQVIRPCES